MNQAFWKDKSYWLTVTILTILCTLIFTIVVRSIFDSDLETHADRALKIVEEGNYGNTSYPLYHFTFIPIYNSVYSMLPDGQVTRAQRITTYIMISGISSISAILLYTIFITKLPRKLNPKTNFLYGFLSIALLTVAPAGLLVFGEWHRYFGYIFGNEYHSPTSRIVEPFAIVLFFLILRVFQKREDSTRVITAMALISALALLAKPSYTFALLPAVIILAFVQKIRKQPVQWKLAILGFIIPSLIILVLQYAYTFESRGNGIGFAPFFTHISRGLTAPEVTIKHVLSVLFPLGVTILYWKDAIRSHMMRVSWTTFFVALGYSLILIETGARVYDRNFNRPLTTAVFILFIAVVMYFLQQVDETLRKEKQLDWRVFVCSGLFLVHVVNGVYFYYLLVSSWQAAYRW